MYENETREAIERRCMDRIDPKFDPRPGGVIQTNIASAAIEFALLYQALDFVDAQISPMTADRTHLESWGSTFGVTPLQPTYAILKARIEMQEGTCPIGTRFMQDELTFTVISYNGRNGGEDDDDGFDEYSLQCEQAGEIGNTAYGRIIPVLNVKGLLSAEIIGTEIPGTDLESDSSLKERFLDNFRNKAYGWNMAQYKQEIAKMQGVGGSKIVRYFEQKDFWVGVYIIDSTFQKASPELISSVQENLLPLLPDFEEPTIQNSGDGMVAIGHVPKVMSAEEVEINLTLHLEFETRYSYEILEQPIREAIQNYLTHECNEKWDDEDNIIVRTSGIETAVLTVDGIIDIYDTEINGDLNNYKLGELQITKLGTIKNEPVNRMTMLRRIRKWKS